MSSITEHRNPLGGRDPVAELVLKKGQHRSHVPCTVKNRHELRFRMMRLVETQNPLS